MTNIDDSSEQKKPKKRLSQRNKIILAALLVLLTFGVYEMGRYTQKWGENNELRAIKAESLASTDLLGLELVESSQRGQGDLVGKAVSPGVSRTFKAEGGDLEATKKKIIEFAESEGWVYDPSISHYGSWWGRKTIGNFDLGVVIRGSLKYDNTIEVEVL